jgi:hypothetical protein
MAAWMYAAWAIAGGVVGWGSLATTRRVSHGVDAATAREVALWGGLLVFAALIYVGFALLFGAPGPWLRVELLGLLVYGGVAAAGLARWPALVGVGWLLHMAWDGLVHGGATVTHVPSWYIPGCIGFDLVVGTMLLRTWYRARER